MNKRRMMPSEILAREAQDPPMPDWATAAVKLIRSAGGKGRVGDGPDPKDPRRIIPAVRRDDVTGDVVVVLESGEKWKVHGIDGKARRLLPPPTSSVPLPVTSEGDAERLAKEKGMRRAVIEVYEADDVWELVTGEGVWKVEKASGKCELIRRRNRGR